MSACNCGSVSVRPSAPATSVCRVGVSNRVLPEMSSEVTRNGALGGSRLPPGGSIVSPVSLDAGSGGAIGCTCCRIEPAPGGGGGAAQASSGTRAISQLVRTGAAGRPVLPVIAAGISLTAIADKCGLFTYYRAAFADMRVRQRGSWRWRLDLGVQRIEIAQIGKNPSPRASGGFTHDPQLLQFSQCLRHRGCRQSG